MATSGALALLLVGSVGLSACSPYVYNQEITGFSNGVDTVAASYQSGQQAVDTIVTQRQQAADATARTRLLLLPGCDQTDPSGTPPKLPDCAIVAWSATAAPPPTVVQKDLADAAPAFDALKAYAASLTAVTAAADETALRQASQSLTTAANGLAGTVAKLAPAASPAGGFVTPVGGVISQGITLYLDQRRLAVLRSTVPAVDPDVQVLGQTVQAALLDIRAQQLLQLGTDLRSDAEPLEVAAASKLSPADYQSKLAALQVRIAAFNQARAADPTGTVAAMVSAHHQLAAALEANSGQQMAVLAAVQTFVTAAGQFKTAVVAADKAAPASPARK
jgi:hypothetical protein